MENVSWKIPGIFKADAQKVYEEIGDGQITPEEVLEKARDESTELHKCFEWDDSIAAEKYRLGQARKILQLLVYTKKSEKYSTPMRVLQITSKMNTYEPSRLLLVQPDEYQLELERAKAALKDIRTRYKMLTELESIFEEIDAL